jgi:hypothetical protein
MLSGPGSCNDTHTVYDIEYEAKAKSTTGSQEPFRGYAWEDDLESKEELSALSSD